jgi:hypothetical protein
MIIKVKNENKIEYDGKLFEIITEYKKCAGQDQINNFKQKMPLNVAYSGKILSRERKNQQYSLTS